MEDDERPEELESIAAIYPELTYDKIDNNVYLAKIDLSVSPTSPLNVRFSSSLKTPATRQDSPIPQRAYIEHDKQLSHLPPLELRFTLPPTYPIDNAPKVQLSTRLSWLPEEKVQELQQEIAQLWDDYGRCQTLFVYLDHVQQAAERGFDLDQSTSGCLVLSTDLEAELVDFDLQTKQQIFAAGTYECSVCLDPKKGTMCYKMRRCGHVFCRQCLQDFYNNAITEGDVGGVKCMDPDCGNEKGATIAQKRKRKERLVHPVELLEMGVEEPIVRRFVEMKRKKKLEADKTTVYCPRTWCQGAAKSAKYPPIPADLRAYIADEVSSDDEAEQEASTPAPEPASKPKIPPNPSDRLAVCEKCSFAFCQVCYMGWHGPYARCYPRDPNELSAEEKASYEYIRLHTSPCAYCNVPVQKTMGCNHMRCFQCNTHFCYLCGAWLEPSNPYIHFNKGGTPCYQRLWELEEGDNGQGPQDGRGFGGGRAWEQMAIEVAREADEAEAEAAALRAQEEEDRHINEVIPDVQLGHHQEIPLVVAMAQVQLVRDPRLVDPAPARGGRRQRNPFIARPPANQPGQAVRNHERAGQQRARAGRGAVAQEQAVDRQQAELQRFLEMAQRDKEDGWNSDELGDDDEGFVIR